MLMIHTNVYAANSVKLNRTKLTLYTNGADRIYLTATVKGPSKKVTWKSSNSSVAAVSTRGKVVAKRTGTATIYAKANGVTAKCVVTVKEGAKYELSKYFNKSGKAAAKIFGLKYETYRPTFGYGYFSYADMDFSIRLYVPYPETNKAGKWYALIRPDSSKAYNFSLYGVSLGTSLQECKDLLKRAGYTRYSIHKDVYDTSYTFKNGKKEIFISIENGKVDNIMGPVPF